MRLRKVHSFDVFDTLIGRRCGTPDRLWTEVARQLQWDEFPWRRIEAEQRIQAESREYTLLDIHREICRSATLPEARATSFADAEFEAELSNVFPIVQNMREVQDGDILVSDMYLSEEQIRQLLSRAGLDRDVVIFVSCYGKFKGHVWRSVRQRFAVRSHLGNSVALDVQRPRRFGMATRFFDSELNGHERFYVESSREIAWFARYLRLSNPHQERRRRFLWDAQASFNVPLLLAACADLRRHVDAKSIDRVLFLSRDGCLFRDLWSVLHPDVEAVYLWGSRQCLRMSSEAYIRYVQQLWRPTACLVDLAGSGRSLLRALPRLGIVKPHVYQVMYLKGMNSDVSSFSHACLTDDERTTCDNTYLEMLNYALHPSVLDVGPDGQPVYGETTDYDYSLAGVAHGALAAVRGDLPRHPLEDPWPIVDYAARRIHERGRDLEAIFPRHMEIERRVHWE